MKHSAIFRRIATHTFLFGAGILIFETFQSGKARALPEPAAALEKSATPPREADDDVKSDATRRTNSSRSPEAARDSTAAYRRAWKDLAYEKLTRPERMAASRDILRQWIGKDWQEALDVVMKETPDDFALLDEFRDQFAREPKAMWALIEDKRYGVLTYHVHAQWRQAIFPLDLHSLSTLLQDAPAAMAVEIRTIQLEKSRQMDPAPGP